MSTLRIPPSVQRALSWRLFAVVWLGAAALYWLTVRPFDASARVELFTEAGLTAGVVAPVYNLSFFGLGVIVWLGGLVFLVGIFFRELLLIVESAVTGRVQSPNVLSFREKRPDPPAPDEARATNLRGIFLTLPFDFATRFLAAMFFYSLGLRAFDIQGMVNTGSPFVRADVFEQFSRFQQYLLVSFFNNVSFVGEFATVSIRSLGDVFFVVLNIVARFFAVFLALNAVFLRLSVLARVSPQSAGIPQKPPAADGAEAGTP